MEQDKDIPIIFIGGMDKDSDLRSVKDGDFIDALNTHNAITDGSNRTGVENVRGNELVTNPDLPPSGINTVVGFREDNKNDAGIYAVYNSNGNHGIYRYFRNSAGNPNGKIETLRKINYPDLYTLTDNPLNFHPDFLITGMDLIDDLFFWTDYHSRPRMMNIIRANDTDKRRKFKIYFNHDILAITGAVGFDFRVYAPNGAMPLSMNWSSTSKTLGGLVADMVTAYKGDIIAAGLFTLTDMGDFAEMEMTSAGKYFPTFTPASENWVVPDNFYPDLQPSIPVLTTYDPFSADLIDRVKYPAAYPPVATYKTDSSRQTNLVQERDFQFRVQYIYDNDEKSVWGAISNIAIPFNACSGIDNNTDNYIEVNFTDPRLNNVSLNCIIKSVNIAVREHTIGDWQIVENLLPWQWGINTNIYKFYNDRTYPILSDQNQFVKPYDSVGKLVKSQQLVNDRLFDAGIVEGYDKQPVDANVIVNYDTGTGSLKTYSIKGIVIIRNVNNGLFQRQFVYGQPIWSQPYQGDTNDVRAYYGAVTHFANTINPLANQIFAETGEFGTYDVCEQNGQYMAMGGHIPYLAGTPYYAVTKQNYFIGGNKFGGNQYGEHNILTANSFSDQHEIGNWMRDFFGAHTPGYAAASAFNPFNIGSGVKDQNGQLIGDMYLPGNDDGMPNRIFSYFEIKNVPEGEYVLRFAAPGCTQADIDSGRYQHTSAKVLSVCGFNGKDGQGYEARIKVNAAEAKWENNSTIYVGESAIADTVSDGADVGPSDTFRKGPYGIMGYVVDQVGEQPPPYDNYYDLLYKETTRIDRALVKFTTSYIGGGGTLATMPPDDPFNGGGSYFLTNYWASGAALADHNGFFWYTINNRLVGNVQLLGTGIQSGSTVSLSIYPYNRLGTAWTGATSSGGTQQGAFGNRDATLTPKARTYLTGTIVGSAGGGIKGVNAVNTHGAWIHSSVSGSFAIPVYRDSNAYWNNPLNDHRADAVVLSTGQSACQIQFQTSYPPYSFNLAPGLPPTYYNDDPLGSGLHWYPLGNILGDIVSAFVSHSAFKNGADIQFGIVYYDQADRACAVCTGDDLKIHFPFNTEKNAAGVQLAANGIPVVAWQVHNEPPPWATKWQWVRTKNLQLNHYLQWAVDSVEYIDENRAPVAQHLAAAKIRIGINNIREYVSRNQNTALSLNFEKGDRVRFINTSGGIPFPRYYDYEILAVGVNAGDLYIEIDNDLALPALNIGDTYEAYSPTNQSALNVYYEFGACYDVGVKFFNGIKKYYHKGDKADGSNDQGYLPLPAGLTSSIPATGTFKYGDVYYKARPIPLNVKGHTSTNPITSRLFFINDPSVSDYYDSNDEMIGRPQTDAIDIGEIERPDAIRFSNRYISDTKINGLSSFDALNQKQLSSNYGLINKLVLIGDDILMAVCDNSKIVTMYINKSILKQASGTALLVAISDEVVQQTNLLMQTLGSQNPESIVLNDDKDVFLWDKQIAVVPRYTGNALVAISDFLMITYFNQRSALQLNYPPEKVKSPAVYDRFFDEYILSFSPISAVAKQSAKAIIYAADMPAPPGFVGMTVNITCQPEGTVLINSRAFGNSSTVKTNQRIAEIINFNYLNNHNAGFTAIVLPDGGVEVTAPEAGAEWNNQSLIVTITDDANGAVHNLNFPMTGGTDLVADAAAGDTVAFSKTKNRWVTRYSFTPEYFGSIRNEIMSFKDGELWLHNVGDDNSYNTFYDDPRYTSQLTFASNKAPLKVKIFKAIAENSNSSWAAPSIEIPPNTQTPTGMQSYLPAGKFVVKEGKYYSDILNDLNTPYATTATEALINGRAMRGEAMKVTLENSDVTQAVLFAVEVVYIYSEKS